MNSNAFRAFASGLLFVSVSSQALAAGDRLSLPMPSTPGTATCQPAAAASGGPEVHLTQTFNDDFDTLDLTGDKWTPHYDGDYSWMTKRTLQGNKEQEIYVDPGYKGQGRKPLGLNPFKVKDGILSIVGERTPDEFKQALYNYQFTSGVLTTRKSFAQTYGYFEMRAKIPEGKGLWPAFWLLPTDKNKWPPELDILEVVGQQADKMVMTAHWKMGGTGAYQHSGCRVPLTTATSGFHTYGALWQPDRITWYIDRKPVQVLTTPPGYDIPMYMLVNLAIGGKMVGVADEGTPLPAAFEIDRISAYQIDGMKPPEAPK
ncbi:glycoside hydrolase family 16 protein [Rhizobium sp. HT1-10]|uniref:glycoside hydrolase family 16 protein n=1 Tax=Rhizobium sp. HT1-10 TaxID=3111638 RepID=UPI003C29E964